MAVAHPSLAIQMLVTSDLYTLWTLTEWHRHAKTNEAGERASKDSRPDCPQVILAVVHSAWETRRDI